MTDIDYSLVKREDLAIVREPRKSKFHVIHKPTGKISETPVAPGSGVEARFRRPSVLPKENRLKDMEGYIEGRDSEDKSFWVIVGGSSPRNEYLDALAKDPEALKASFDPSPSAELRSKARIPDVKPPVDDDGVVDPTNTSIASAEPPVETVDDDEMADLDALLANLDSSPTSGPS